MHLNLSFAKSTILFRFNVSNIKLYTALPHKILCSMTHAEHRKSEFVTNAPKMKIQ